MAAAAGASRRSSEAPSAGERRAPLRLPVPLFIPCLVTYGRILLSVYALAGVAGSVHRRALESAAAAAAAAASPVQALTRTAYHWYLSSTSSTSSSSGSSGSGGGGKGLDPNGKGIVAAALGLLVPGSSALGRGIDHLLQARASPSSSVDTELLAALVVFVLAALLDAVDGLVARGLHQTSGYGVLLDVVADNVLRTCLWLASALLDARAALPALVSVSVEWWTLLASQVVSLRDGGRHWKRLRQEDPWPVRYFFRNNFRNVLGVWGIGGLFLAPMYTLLLHTFPATLLVVPREGEAFKRAAQSATRALGWVAFGGRLLSLGIELYFVWGLLTVLVEEDEQERCDKAT